MSEFESQLQDWYQSEIAGKAFFDIMADGTQNDDEANKWSLLARLEATMAQQAPAAHAPIAGEFLAHEEVLAAFVSAELKGEDGSPAVQSLLSQWP